MRDWDLEFLMHFLSRPGMYTGSNTDDGYKGIDKFLVAYEMGAMGECTFRQQLSEQLGIKYGIPMPAMGLEEQLKLVSGKANKTWQEIFVRESQAILIRESDELGDFRYARIIRRKLLQELKRIIEEQTFLVINWYAVERQIKEWKGENLIEEELELFFDISKQLKQNGIEKIVSENKLDNELKREVKKFIELLTKNPK